MIIWYTDFYRTMGAIAWLGAATDRLGSLLRDDFGRRRYATHAGLPH